MYSSANLDKQSVQCAEGGKNFTIRWIPEFIGDIMQEFALKVNIKNYRENFRKTQQFHFWARCKEKNTNYYGRLIYLQWVISDYSQCSSSVRSIFRILTLRIILLNLQSPNANHWKLEFIIVSSWMFAKIWHFLF